MNLPRARRDDLLTTNLDDEVVVYDPERKQAHSLNRVAVAVWSHSDGTKTIEELQRAASEEVGVPVDQGAVWLALSKLEKAHLLLGKVSTAGAMTRRDMLSKAGRYGAAAMATPLVISALVPTAAQAAISACSQVFDGSTTFICGTGCECLTTVGGGTATTCLNPGTVSPVPCTTINGVPNSCVDGFHCVTVSGSGNVCLQDCAPACICP